MRQLKRKTEGVSPYQSCLKDDQILVSGEHSHGLSLQLHETLLPFQCSEHSKRGRVQRQRGNIAKTNAKTSLPILLKI